MASANALGFGAMTDRSRTDQFRIAPRQPLVVAALAGALAALAVAALILGWRTAPQAERLAGVAALAVLGGLIAAALWIARRRPVILRVGPEGILLPLVWRAPLGWGAIHRISCAGRKGWTRPDRDWLRIDPSPGVLPAYRLPGPRRLELWHVRRSGLRLPIGGLDRPADEVVASIERFRPVRSAD